MDFYFVAVKRRINGADPTGVSVLNNFGVRLERQIGVMMQSKYTNSNCSKLNLNFKSTQPDFPSITYESISFHKNRRQPTRRAL